MGIKLDNAIKAPADGRTKLRAAAMEGAQVQAVYGVVDEVGQMALGQAEVRKALPMLVCWPVRFMITGKLGSGPLELGNSDRAKDVSMGNLKPSKQLYDPSTGFLVADAHFEQAFATARVSQHYLARFYLRVLEKKERCESSWRTGRQSQ